MRSDSCSSARTIAEVANKRVTRSKLRFTDLQGRYLAFIQTYATLHGVAPAERDMQRFFRVTPPAFHRMVLALEQRGLIERVPGRSRSIGLLISSDEVPKLHGAGATGSRTSRFSGPRARVARTSGR